MFSMYFEVEIVVRLEEPIGYILSSTYYIDGKKT